MVVFTHVASVLFYLVKGFKITASHPTMSGHNGDLTGQNYTPRHVDRPHTLSFLNKL